MTLSVPGVGDVPVKWMPASDEDYKDASEGGRSGYQPIAIVHHRIVGSLNSADIVFAKNDTDRSTIGSEGRSVSANFAIGYDSDGKLYVHQYVDLSDTAYCNGDCRALTHPAEPSRWDKWYGHRGHNERTVSIEHDDQGGSSDATKKGIVREPIIRTSIALDRLMLSGNLAAIRAAGIRIRDQATATALGKIVPTSKTLIDHNDIAGANKPTCWRPWKADTTGFPRARYVAELSAPVPVPSEGDMPPLVEPDVTGYLATVKTNSNVRSSPKIDGNVLRVVDAPETWKAIGWVRGEVDPESGSDLWLIRWSGSRYEYTAKVNLATGPSAPPTFDQGFAAAKKKAGEASAAAIAAITPG